MFCICPQAERIWLPAGSSFVWLRRNGSTEARALPNIMALDVTVAHAKKMTCGLLTAQKISTHAVAAHEHASPAHAVTPHR